ncbi:outer membrane beta-barrel family protein [Mucilaginibacter sp. PAMB04274]|uniref:outer membrane beta-barrel family protein n=1 Tax=Mucilaginibacter sp. PAMB04274 TaxID=3138568 RepID=UPI0031F5FE80
MSRILTSLLLLLTFSASLQAQNSIIGNVIDSATKRPLDFVTAVLKDQYGSIKYSTSSQQNGLISFTASHAKYTLLLTSIGYRDKILPIDLKEQSSNLNLGNIELTSTTNTLKEVSVQGKKSALSFAPGKIIYSVATDLRAEGKSGLEVLRYAPLVSINGTESIRLKGQDNFRILLNGKSNAALNTNVGSFLQSLDSKDIESIEVITIPSAKYSAQGIGGIINIITKKSKVDGTFGAVGAGIDTYNTSYLNGSLSGREGKFGYSLIASGGFFRNGTYDYSLVQADNGITHDYQGRTTPKRKQLNSLAQFSYDFNANNLLNIDVNGYTGDGNITQYFAADNISSVNTINHLVNHNYGIGGGFEHKFNKKASLIFSYKYNKQKDRSEITYLSTETNNSNNRSQSSENIIQLDYVNAGFETGLRTSLRDFNSDVRNSESSYFTQNIYGAYVSYSKKIKSINVLAGTRGEVSDYQNTTGSQVFIDNKKFNLFPSISIDKTFTESRINIGLGYTSRINRPQIYYLNPFRNNSNPYVTNSGNAALVPEISHNVELRITKDDNRGNNYLVMFSYTYNKNAIQGYSSFQADSSVNTQFINLNSQKTLGLNASSTITFAKKIELSFSSNLYYSLMKKAFPDNTLLLNNNGFYGSFSADLTTKLFKNYNVALSNIYNLRDVYLQGYGTAFFYQDLTLSRSILEKKLRLTFSLRQPFIKDYAFRRTYPDLYQQSESITPQQRLFFSARYSFGKPKKANSQTKKKASADDKKNKNNVENIN